MKHTFLLFCLVANNLYGQIAISAYTGGEVIESKSTHAGHESSGEPGFNHLSYLVGGAVELGILPILGLSYSFEQSPKVTHDTWAGSIAPWTPGYTYTLRKHGAQMRFYLWSYLDMSVGWSQNVLVRPFPPHLGFHLDNAKSFGPTASLRARYKNFLLESSYYRGVNKYEVHRWETYRVQIISVKVGYRSVFTPFRKKAKVRCPKF